MAGACDAAKVAVWWRGEDGGWVVAHSCDDWDEAYGWAMASAVYDPTLVGLTDSSFPVPGYVVY